MNNGINISFFITGYAAIVATISLIWNIIKYYKENKTKLKVTATVTALMTGIPGEAVSDPYFILSVKIINRSKNERFLRRPSISLPKKVNGYDVYQSVSLNESNEFPLSLEPGEEYKYEIELSKNLIDILEPAKLWWSKYTPFDSKIKIKIFDTLGNSFYSNKIKIKVLEEYYKENINR
ncbi:hypothetical protein [Halanaerobium congolense]|uniref:hypothetical protein n=1 Tax=Halanaerobium congolense TaxID=54121 RepID=UPI00091D79AD|nr:hypothetical protein [Halanaerobium congolense]SHN02108.1 hypothetical protein SAMN04515650_1177 [Halanaerobium congolense]